MAGYPPSGADGLVSRLRTSGFHDAEIIDAGWGVRTQSNNVIDRFRRRVLFPYRAEEGNVLGVIGRDVTCQARQKYINTPTTVAFRKSAVLYEPRRDATSHNVVVICEGPLDALAVVANSTELGFQSARAVAVSGTALTATHANALKRVGASLIVLLPDGDRGGEAARSKWREALQEAGLATSDGYAPEGLDPAAWIASAGASLNLPREHCPEV
jgi:DNA primase